MIASGHTESRYNVIEPASHSLHACRNVDEFLPQFEAAVQCRVQNIADHVIAPGAPKAILLVGSLPLGMANSGSDIDLFVLVDSRSALHVDEQRGINSDQRLEFANDSDALLAGEFAALSSGLLVDLHVVITPTIRNIYRRLRRKGPELTEGEVRTLGRLSTAWLLWQSEDYLKQHDVVLKNDVLNVYCCTKHFVSALVHRRKAEQALDLNDTPLALHLARISVEAAYLAYFAREGMPFLGSKWPAQISRAREAAERCARHPLLTQGRRLLFPTFTSSTAEAAVYLREVRVFIAAMQSLIEEKVLFRIAFRACAQIASA